MWLIAGLGNPGSRYEQTRHNVGFLILEAFQESRHLAFSEKEDYRISKGSMGDEKIILLEPLTFMNRSGIAVRKIMTKAGVTPAELIVVHDDLDIETGRLKIRTKGSSGGHKGVESIIQNIGTQEFVRIRIGIGRDPLIPTEKYVLSRFRKDETPLVRDAIRRAVEALHSIILDGIDKAMNRFN